jgi:TolB-like protein
MRYRFDRFELDAERFELREDGAPLTAEPQVLSLLLFLVANRDRLVGKDEIIETVWRGRIVSDSALSSRVKSARRLLGDDGGAQRFIRTVHGRGFRFIADVEEAPTVFGSPPTASAQEPSSPARPAIAVLPFAVIGELGPLAIVGEALPHEVIRELSRLRWLLVIARGSAFRFSSAALDVRRTGEALGVGYLLTGAIEAIVDRLAVSVELVDAHDESVLWAERFEAPAGALHALRAEMVVQVLAALELRIPLHEADRAQLAAPEGLDAWSAYHLGLQRMYRFTQTDNGVAAALFSRAINQAPGFARAHAGLSFTRFQDAFLGYAADPVAAENEARRAAERAVMLDPLDPFANTAVGRAHWLSGDLEAGLPWLDRALELSPNYAQGAYARAWTETLLGRGEEGRRHADRALALSPVDPLRYAMLATRGLSHLVEGEAEPAALWAERAAREPGAHALIAVIAAACHATLGDRPRAQSWIGVARERHPGVSRERFFRSFPFADPDLKAQLDRHLLRAGL